MVAPTMTMSLSEIIIFFRAAGLSRCIERTILYMYFRWFPDMMG